MLWQLTIEHWNWNTSRVKYRSYALARISFKQTIVNNPYSPRERFRLRMWHCCKKRSVGRSRRGCTTLRQSKRLTHNTSQNSRKVFAFLTCSYLSGSWTRIPTGAKCIYILFSVFNLKRVQRCTSSKYRDFFKFQNHLVLKKFSRFLITKSCIGVQHDSTVQLEG